VPLRGSADHELGRSKTMPLQDIGYGVRVDVPLAYPEAVQRARAALKKEGFGVLTEIDVRATLKEKIDVDVRPYVILGACNPPLAHQALSTITDIGLLLPCNVIVYATDDPERSTVAAIDPVAQLAVTGDDRVQPIAEEVRARLERVFADLTAG
jgi:uncharacterized protein (DUF302 family)